MTCNFIPQEDLEEQKQKKEIQARIEAGEKKKKLQRKQNLKFTCPYGCGTTFFSYRYDGAKKHLLSCKDKDDAKMVSYMKEKNLMKH